MAITFSQFVYGWQVTTGTNDSLPFVEAGASKTATLSPGFYSPYAFAAEVQRAMRAAVGGGSTTNTCTWSQSTLKFTLGGTATFSLLFGTGTATNPATLLGFTSGGGAGNDKTGSTSYTSASAAGTSPSTASLWTMAEPNDYTSPVTAQAVGTPALLTRRKVYGTQNITDGAAVEGIYFSTLRWVEIGFRALTSTEQTKMESFLDWATKMRPFIWQPDSTSANGLILVADFETVKTINNDFEWLTRSETSYGRLRFYEDTTR